MNKQKILAVLLVLVVLLSMTAPYLGVFARPLSATSPTLGASASYSVLAGSTVTNTGATTTYGDVGVAPGTAIIGFPPGIAGPPGTIQSNTASAIAAQADNLIVFGVLDQTCDQTFGAVDLTTTFPDGVAPGVYCSTSSFTLSGNLNLTGSGVWIFKTVSTLITSPGSSVTGGDPCNVWWRVGSSATLDTTTSFIGNIFALTDITLNTGATLNGRALAQTGQVVLDSNTISGPICALQPTAIPTGTSPTITATTGTAATATYTPVVPGLPGSGGAPIRSNDFPWSLAIVAGFGVIVFAFGVRIYRSTYRPK